MNVALVFNAMDGPDSTSSSLSTSEHLGIGYLAASLRSKGHKVLLVNSEVQGLDAEQTFLKIVRFSPQVVGCSPVSLSINNTLELLKKIKEYDRLIYTVLGGHLASMCAMDIISSEPFVDFILKGDAEFSLLDLLKRVSSADPDMVYVPGMVYREAGVVFEMTIQPTQTVPFGPGIDRNNAIRWIKYYEYAPTP